MECNIAYVIIFLLSSMRDLVDGARGSLKMGVLIVGNDSIIWRFFLMSAEMARKV